jgi:hypothetical protein
MLFKLAPILAYTFSRSISMSEFYNLAIVLKILPIEV